MTSPHFQHDCEECVYIGHYDEHDLYRCPQMGMPTIVARFGDDGPDYDSGPKVRLAAFEWEATTDGWIGRPTFGVYIREPSQAMMGDHTVGNAT